IHGVAIHPQENQVASAGEDGTIRVWRLPTAARPLAGHSMPVAAVAVSGNGKLIVTGSADKTVRLWNPVDGMGGQLTGHAAAVGGVAVNEDATQVASGDAGGAIRFWNAAGPAAKAAGELAAHTAQVTGLAYHPDGKQLLSSSADGTVKWWQLPFTPPKAFAGHAQAVHSVVFSADLKLLVTGAADGNVRIFDIAAGNQTREAKIFDKSMTSVALAPKLTQAAAADIAGTIKFFDAGGKAADPVEPADKHVTTDQLAGHVGAIHKLAFDPTGQQIASAGADGTVRIWKRPALPQLLAENPSPVTVFIVSNDGKLVASAGKSNARPAVFVRDLATGKITATLLGHGADITSIAFNSNNTQLGTGSADKTARVWSLADAKFPELVKLEGHAQPVTAVAFSADNTQLFTGGADNAIKQWTVADGAEVRTIAGHTAAITALMVRGTTLFSGAADNTIRLWTVANGAAVRTVNHGTAVTSLTVTADGARIAAGAADNTVKLWNAANAAAIATLTGHTAPTSSVAFS
ncbi:MAG: WD40 repeat domain-containing protein, partial [Planctomycetota bacterium]|nr:WD40 repeat domain-containing protein [Planctomycetota bacterium]